MAELTITDLHLYLGGNHILQGITESFQSKRIIVLLGRSGSGKTTLLRAVAGLETPSEGRIELNGKPLVDVGAGLFVPPEKRDLGLVFQSYALWPHRTVADNVAYGLKLRGVPRDQRDGKTAAILRAVGMETLGKRYPSELSGGQQQRVALARALVYGPPLVLMDEPLSNLDAKLREEARHWIRGLIREMEQTAIFVTHDQTEAMSIADEVVLLDQGRVVQRGSPQRLYANPNSFFAADFVGVNDIFEVTVRAVAGDRVEIDLAGQTLSATLRGDGPPPAVGSKTRALARVENTRQVDGPGANRIAVEREDSLYLGGYYEHVFRAGDTRVRVNDPHPATGDRAWIELPAEALWVF